MKLSNGPNTPCVSPSSVAITSKPRKGYDDFIALLRAAVELSGPVAQIFIIRAPEQPNRPARFAPVSHLSLPSQRA